MLLFICFRFLGYRKNFSTYHSFLRKIEKTAMYYAHLSPNLAVWLTLIGSNYPSMVPKMFEVLRFFGILLLKQRAIMKPFCLYLTLSTLGRNFNRRQIGDIFSYFSPRKQDLEHWRQFAWNVGSFFCGKSKNGDNLHEISISTFWRKQQQQQQQQQQNDFNMSSIENFTQNARR